jgi:mycoredoxin
MSEKILFYGHSGCPSVPLVRTMLEHAGAEFEYINIRSDETGRMRLQAINHGYESVPTLTFPDGSILTEPSNAILHAKLLALGYAFQIPAWVVAFENLLNKMATSKK